MNTNSVSTTQNQSVAKLPYTDHSQDYIPRTSPWKKNCMCDYIDPENVSDRKKCCSGIKTLDRAIDKAYRHGIQSHLGIRAIQDYPCVTPGEMSKLSNDLDKAIKRNGIKMEVPRGLDPTERPLGASKKILDYCKEVIFEKLSRELGRANESKPIAFTKEIVRYCQYALTLRPSPIDSSTYLNQSWD